MTEKETKTISRQINRNNYLKSTYILIFRIIITSVISVLPYSLIRLLQASDLYKNADASILSIINIIIIAICAIISEMLYTSISTGEAAWYSGKQSGKRNCFKRLIYWLLPPHSFKAFCIGSIVFILKLSQYILFCLPGIMTLFSAVILAFTGGIELYLFLSLIVGSAIMLICGNIFSFILNQRYFLVKHLLAENPQLGIFQVIKQSCNLSEGQIFKIIRFKLKFFPSLLLFPLIFPIIYLYPRYKQRRCIIAKELYL